MTKGQNENTDSVLEQVTRGLKQSVDAYTSGGKAERIKKGLGELLTVDTAKKAGIAAGIGAGAGLILPVLTLTSGAVLAASGYLYFFKIRPAYNEAKSDKSSI
ncbi:hypothetical protein HZA33_02620 [Candidatus Pacearchaeota archaeon]|nr:hypothetical protein [Candidatus Pacearchaeota archaeon]